MSMARPAAEIEPNSWIFSSSWIFPGPIRPSASRSMRRLRVGNDASADFCMESGFLIRGRQIATAAMCGQGGPAAHPYESTRLADARKSFSADDIYDRI